MRIRWLVVVCGFLLLGGGCGREEAVWVSPVAFDTAVASIRTDSGSVRLLVETARSPDQRSFGLMLRPRLDPGSGMIFLYDSVQSEGAAFWMWRTRVPLEIAFLDSAGTVVRVLQMEPCTSVYLEGCEVYEPGVPYWSALEVNRGWFEANGVGVGAVVEVGEGGS